MAEISLGRDGPMTLTILKADGLIHLKNDDDEVARRATTTGLQQRDGRSGGRDGGGSITTREGAS